MYVIPSTLHAYVIYSIKCDLFYYFFTEKSFARKSQSTYGSFNTLNGGDDRNHGSAEVISAMRDDESEENDTEMLNDSGGTSATTAPANGDNDDAVADVEAEAEATTMDQDDAGDQVADTENVNAAERIDDDVEIFDPSNEPNQEQRKWNSLSLFVLVRFCVSCASVHILLLLLLMLLFSPFLY